MEDIIKYTLTFKLGKFEILIYFRINSILIMTTNWNYMHTKFKSRAVIKITKTSDNLLIEYGDDLNTLKIIGCLD